MENKTNYEIVDSVEQLEKALARVREAQRIFATYTQEARLTRFSAQLLPLPTRQEFPLQRWRLPRPAWAL